MSLTQNKLIALNRQALGLPRGPADWAYHKLVAEKLGSITSQEQTSPGIKEQPSGPQAAILIGHTPGTGADAFDGVNEWEWNEVVRDLVLEKLDKLGVNAISIQRTELNYGDAVEAYAEDINKMDSIKAIVELHFNSSDSEDAEGYEYIENGDLGARLARVLANSHGKTFPWQKSRGHNGIRKPFRGRGNQFLKAFREAAVICEPAFGSNKDEWTKMRDMRDEYASSIATGILNYLNERTSS